MTTSTHDVLLASLVLWVFLGGVFHLSLALTNVLHHPQSFVFCLSDDDVHLNTALLSSQVLGHS